MTVTTLRPFAWSLAIAFAASWGLGIIWWALLEPAGASDDVYELFIPEGTAAAVAAGQPAPFIPNSLELSRRGAMIVKNNDVVAHKVGTWTIQPGEQARIEASGSDGSLSCTIHPQGIIGIHLDKRPPFISTFVSAFGIGIPMGLVFGFAAVVGSRLGAQEEL